MGESRGGIYRGGEKSSLQAQHWIHTVYCICLEEKGGKKAKKKKKGLVACVCSRAAGAGCPVAPSEKVNVREWAGELWQRRIGPRV